MRTMRSTYIAFLKKLRTRYPDTYFILWATDAADGEIQAEAQKVSHQVQAGADSRVTFIAVKRLDMSGCHWHPSAKDDEVIAGKLIEFIDQHPEAWGQR